MRHASTAAALWMISLPVGAQDIHVRPGPQPDQVVIDAADRPALLKLVAEQVRLHEAAHAVVALELGLTLVSTEVRPPAVPHGTMTGETIVAIRVPRPGERSSTWENAVAILAGPVLTREMKIPRLVADIVCSGDTEALAALGLSAEENGRAESHAMDLVRQHRREIDAVGRALAESPRLSGDDVRVLLATLRDRNAR